MKILRFILVSVLTIAATSGLQAARSIEITSLRQMMSEEEFRAAGLEKLSPEEMAALETWLRHVTGTVEKQTRDRTKREVEVEAQAQAEAQARENFGKEAEPADEMIESRILGRFTGWDGATVFRLENGQVWRQRDTSRYYQPVNDPTVVIRRTRFGYRLTVEGFAQSVGVVRVK